MSQHTDSQQAISSRLVARRVIRPPRFLRPAQSCPECGEAPPVRVSMFERRRYAKLHPSEEVQTVACSRCQTIYRLTADSMARAG